MFKGSEPLLLKGVEFLKENKDIDTIEEWFRNNLDSVNNRD